MPNTLLKCTLLALALLATAGAAMAQSPRDKTFGGEYARIDIRLQKETMDRLSGEQPDARRAAIEQVIATPGDYAPPVFYLLSTILFSEDRKDEALFWFYAGQLRARIDANRSADLSAREVVNVLNQNYGATINPYALQNVDNLETLIPRVVEWDRNTPRNYDQRWINLHGLDAVRSTQPGVAGKPLSLPRNQWPAIAENTRNTYLEHFRESITQLKARQGQQGQ